MAKHPNAAVVVPIRQAVDDSTPIVVLSLGQLREALRDLAEEREAVAIPTPEPITLSGAQLAQRLGVSRTTVHRMREDGCPCFRLGDSWRFELEPVMAWLRGRQ